MMWRALTWSPVMACAGSDMEGTDLVPVMASTGSDVEGTDLIPSDGMCWK